MGARASKESIIAENLTEKDIEHLVGSTHFTKQDVVNFHQSFIRSCPAGLIKRKEFTKLFKELQPSYVDTDKADVYCEYLFNAFDTDSSGCISFHELLLALSITSYGDVREKIQLAFKIFDLDKNNRIDRKEMSKVIGSLYDLAGIPRSARVDDMSPANRVDKIMEQLDINHDNVLSVDEFISGCLADEHVRQFLINPLFKHKSFV